MIAAVAIACLLVAAAGIAWARSHDGSTSTLTAAGMPLTVSQVQAAVDPAIVDINAQLDRTSATAGTGMVIGSEGVILTNHHVISGATSITVSVHGSNTEQLATLVGSDASHDVAVLKVAEMTGAPTIQPGTGSPVAVGVKVVVIGNALGKGGLPPAQGAVAALNRTVKATDAIHGDVETLTDMIELTADVEPGDSGGAVIDLYGRVIGMTTAGSRSGVQPASTTTTGFAIPIGRAVSIAQQIAAG